MGGHAPEYGWKRWLLDPLDWVCKNSIGNFWIPCAVPIVSAASATAEKFSHTWYALILTGVSTGVSLVLVSYRKRDLQKSQEERATEAERLLSENERLSQENIELKQNVPHLFYALLRDISRSKLSFHEAQPYDERLSLYVHDSLSKFQMIARTSMNPDLESPGRVWYPDGQGCIGEAWRNGRHIQTMPKDSNAWCDKCVSMFKMPREIAEGITMKSAIYGIIRLSDSQGKPIAVVAFESRNPKRYTKKQMETLIEDTFSDSNHNPIHSQLVKLIETYRPWIGDLGVARGKGF